MAMSEENIAQVSEIDRLMNHMAGTAEILPQWPVKHVFFWCVAGAVIWFFSKKIHHHMLVSRIVQVLAVFCFVLGVGALLPTPMLQWGLLAFVIGLGWSARNYVVDMLSGLVIYWEARFSIGSWIEGEGFSGKLIEQSWRCLILEDAGGNKMVIPGRYLLIRPVKVYAPGNFPAVINVCVPRELDLSQAIVLVEEWLRTSPYLSAERSFSLEIDSQNLQLLNIGLFLLRMSDKNTVARMLQQYLLRLEKRKLQDVG